MRSWGSITNGLLAAATVAGGQVKHLVDYQLELGHVCPYQYCNGGFYIIGMNF